ncbi:hypothetical protein P691DRAFT_353225 [Macrolepiota fuliginosa MF-IS2]|uniref:Uncharacterized protein n=1 Tax=Macrolepiota fuliginosa MF-IS2 TaxID=1400762 RepID=A0A9P5XHK0_9AGAR|nr:hypothetical protein P691DRAFT_353225 [Macrolepiota fuliginosa MF-IS2]
MLGMEAEFEETPVSPLTETQVELIEDVSAAIPTPQTGKASSEPIVIDEVPTEPSTQETVTTSTVLEVADVTITIEEDAAQPPKEYISFSGEEQFTYFIEEPLTDSEYCASEGLERGVSIGIASVQSDEVIPPTIVKGDVEELISDTEPDQGKAPVSHDGGVATVVPQTVAETVEESDVKDTQLSDQDMDEMTETRIQDFFVEPALANPPTLLTPPLGTNHEDYFAQPGSPIIEPTLMKLDVPGQANLPMTPNGSLPSIIQLPGTPQKVLSPVSTPGPGPTPVSIAVEPAVLKALRTNRDFVKVLTSPPIIPAPQQTQQPTTTDVAPPTATENNSDTTAAVPQQQATVEPLPLSEVSAPVYSPSELGDQSSTNDPYPYSLSTPGPVNEETEEGSEEDTEQDNSMSTSSSVNSVGKESDEPIFENAVKVELGYPPTVPAIAAEMKVDEIVENVLEVEKGLVDIEAEADALIDEFLVDELESDTDADGEADPEFVDLESSVSARASEECVAQQVEEVEVENSGVTEVEETKEVPMKEAEVVPKEGGRDGQFEEGKEQTVPSKETGGEKAVAGEEEEQDAFKLMGNDSMVAPGEVLDMTPSEKSSSEEQSGGEAGAIESAPLAPEPKEIPVIVPSTAPRAGVTLVAQPHPPIVPSHGIPSPSVGVVPYHVAAAAYHESSRLNTQTPSGLLPFGQVTAPIYSLQQKEQQEALRITQTPEHANSATQKSPLARTSQDVEPQGTITPTPGTKVEELPRKVRVSVEDPYNADNDSDREHGSNTSRNGKRKRSLSDVSGTELPSIASKSSKGKGKATGSRTTAKVSRPRKEGSKKSYSK